MYRLASHAVALWCLSLLVVTLTLTSVAATTQSDTVPFSTEEIAESVCCERVDAKWTYLKVWSEWCRTVPDLTERTRGARKLVDALLDARQHAADATSLSNEGDEAALYDQIARQPCTTETLLKAEVVKLFVRDAWCRGLPTTHNDIVYSPYTVYAEEYPHAEDELVDLLASLCARVWQSPLDSVVRRVYASLARASSAREAQHLLCGRVCDVDADDDTDL